MRFATTAVLLFMCSKKEIPVAMHWFRKALRLHDNPALLASISKNGKVYPVYILDGDCYQLCHCSPVRANFLIECLSDLDASLKSLGSRLYVACGDPTLVLPDLWEKFKVSHLTFEKDETGEPYALERDTRVLKLAQEKDIQVETFPSETLFSLKAYVNRCSGIDNVPNAMRSFQSLFGRMGKVNSPLDVPKQFPPQDHSDMNGEMLPPTKPTELSWPRNVPRENITPLWRAEDCKNITPVVRGGETVALEQLNMAVQSRPAWVASFSKPDTSCVSLKPSTTLLSPFLSLGCVSPRTLWYAVAEAMDRAASPKTKPPVSLHGQLLWREFNNLMAHTANTRNPGSFGKMEGNPYCRQIPWVEDETMLNAWKTGRTGYPWIDACMTQLAREGWIHHLGRHAVACFLTRGDLWQSWEVGAVHFESQLLDADYAINNFNWLWLSCSGFFYQYFRCYSPVAFQKKNDPSGTYIRKWIPELVKLPNKYIYEPWKAPIAVQKAAGVRIGQEYPKPIVDHSVVSRENMSRMSLAYDMHKESMGELKKQVKEQSKGPAKKKLKQTKLK